MAVYWVTGLSGAGKTTIGREIYLNLKSKLDNVVFLDGDDLRVTMGGDFGFDLSERKKLAYTYGKLTKLISDQGIHVVIATISMFNDVRDWNRANMKNYIEIYVKAPVEILVERDQKKIYSTNQKNVIGFNTSMEEPLNPDIVLLNDGGKSPKEIVDEILVDLLI